MAFFENCVERATALAATCGWLAFASGGAEAAVGVAIGGAGLAAVVSEAVRRHGPESDAALKSIRKRIAADLSRHAEMERWDNRPDLQAADASMERALVGCFLDRKALAASARSPEGFPGSATKLILARLAERDPGTFGSAGPIVARDFAELVVRTALEAAIENESYFKNLHPHLLMEMLRGLATVEEKIDLGFMEVNSTIGRTHELVKEIHANFRLEEIIRRSDKNGELLLELAESALKKKTDVYVYNNPKDAFSYETANVQISDHLIERIDQFLNSGHKHIENVSKHNPDPLGMAWVMSFVSIVREIDPLGFSGRYSNEQSNSLTGEWHSAQYTSHSSHDIKIMKLSMGELNRERFGSYLGIVMGLQTGWARVVINRLANPLFVKSKGSCVNPLDDFTFEYGLRKLDACIHSEIVSKLEKGFSFIEDVQNGSAGPLQMAWIKSFEPIIRRIDELGVSGRYSNEQSLSLIGDWHYAQYSSYSSYDIESMDLRNEELNAERFAQYLSIVYSLLIGKAQIVTSRTNVF